MLVGITALGQEKVIQKTEAKDELKVIYYHDNGLIQQEGYLKNNKPNGQWIAYNNKGQKTAIAHYDEGDKVGKWFFWKEGKLTEVDYDENEIASVKSWKESTMVVDKN
jgi:antitoxin component YwqK of YwqJK toxin-antitoxin module